MLDPKVSAFLCTDGRWRLVIRHHDGTVITMHLSAIQFIRLVAEGQEADDVRSAEMPAQHDEAMKGRYLP